MLSKMALLGSIFSGASGLLYIVISIKDMKISANVLLGLFIMIVFLGCIVLLAWEKYRENQKLKAWIGFPDIMDLEKRGYHNLAEMIMLTIRDEVRKVKDERK